MEQIILNTAKDLFLTYGYKSVTMDDLANKLGMSKKTLYVHFKNKEELIVKVLFYVNTTIENYIEDIKKENYTPIEEFYRIKNFAVQVLENEKSPTLSQLQKFYPKIYLKLIAQHSEMITKFIANNLQRGISLNLYRANIDCYFITKIYLSCVMAIKDNDIFPIETYDTKKIMTQYLEYHLRGICTQKGLDLLIEYANINYN